MAGSLSARVPAVMVRPLMFAALAPALVGVLTLPLLAAAPAEAQSAPTYVTFTPGSVKGALYKPDTGPAPHVAGFQRPMCLRAASWPSVL